jgi:hypothetical protein
MTYYPWYRVSEWHDANDQRPSPTRRRRFQLRAGATVEPLTQQACGSAANCTIWPNWRAELARLGVAEPGERPAVLGVAGLRGLGRGLGRLLEGAFAVAIWHVRERRLVVANDPMACIPLLCPTSTAG